MLSLSLLGLILATCVKSAPVERRADMTMDELTDGECRDVTFIMARGSTETGNMVRDSLEEYSACTDCAQGSTVGPPTCQGLKDT